MIEQAQDPATAPTRLAELARTGDAKVQAAVAANPSASSTTLGYLASHCDDFWTLTNVSAHPGSSAATLRVLAGSPIDLVAIRAQLRLGREGW